VLCFENAHSKGVMEIFLEVRILKDLGFVSESKSTLADTSASADPKGLSVGSKMKKGAAELPHSNLGKLLETIVARCKVASTGRKGR
jgi:hypothetical protein